MTHPHTLGRAKVLRPTHHTHNIPTKSWSFDDFAGSIKEEQDPAKAECNQYHGHSMTSSAGEVRMISWSFDDTPPHTGKGGRQIPTALSFFPI